MDLSSSLPLFFSHLDIAGNELVDHDANDACQKIGFINPPTSNDFKSGLYPCYGFAEYDTLRPPLHQLQDNYIISISDHKSFRFRNYSSSPSPSLPIEARIPRQDETLLFRARLGIFSQIGGFLPNRLDPCPLCGAIDVLGRSGKTIEHLFKDCTATSDLREEVEGMDNFNILWDCPPVAVLILREILFRAIMSSYSTECLSLERKNKLMVEYFSGLNVPNNKYLSFVLLFSCSPSFHLLSFLFNNQLQNCATQCVPSWSLAITDEVSCSASSFVLKF